MNLKNGYKTLFEVIEDSERVFYASKTGLFIDKERIASYPVNSVKVIYQDANHNLCGINKDGSVVNLRIVNDLLFTETKPELPKDEEIIIPEESEKVESPNEMPGEAVTEPEEKGEEVTEGETEEV